MMKRRHLLPLLLLAALPAVPASAQTLSAAWQAVPALQPAGEADYGKGVSAPFAGVLDGQLLVAGGCNFPGVPAAQGGKKSFYAGAYALPVSGNERTWRKVGELPCPTAYGLSLAAPEGLVCLGGQSPEGSLSSACLLSLAKKGRRLRRTPLPDLPCTADNMAGALVGRRVYVVGGNMNGRPSRRMFSLSLDSLSAGWREEPALPGPPRTQAVALPLVWKGERCLFLFGGFAGGETADAASVSTLSLFFVPSQGRWFIAAAPTDEARRQVALGGGAGYALNDTIAVLCGGVNKDIFLAALRREAQIGEALKAGDTERHARLCEEKQRYMEMPPADYRLNTRLLLYNAAEDRWRVLDNAPQAARAGAALAGSDGTCYQVGGETKPGIRTAETWKIAIGPGRP